tara:strand:+ start:40 stop:1890 length:1851 start_codon:yes stop_codon:yes gene_type:complete
MNKEDNLSEDGLTDPYESELKKEKEAENKRIEDAKDDLTEGKIRRARSRRGNAGNVEEPDEDGFFSQVVKVAGKGLQSYGAAMDRVDQEVLGRIGVGDKNLYTARTGLIQGLSKRHVALGLLGEFLLPDSVDLATAGLGYIPKRFLKTPKLLKKWAQMTKASTAAEQGGDVASFAALGGRPRLAQRTAANELGDELLDVAGKTADQPEEITSITRYYEAMLEKAKKNPGEKLTDLRKTTDPVNIPKDIRKKPPAKTTPERMREKILAGEPIKRGGEPGVYSIFDIDLASRGAGKEKRVKYTPTVRKHIEKIDIPLAKKLQQMYGGTDEQVKAFVKQQNLKHKEIVRVVSRLNDLQRNLQKSEIGGTAAARLKGLVPGTPKYNEVADQIVEEILQVDKSAFFDKGHLVSAKNVFRQGDLGANRSSNIYPEIAKSLQDRSRLSDEVIQTIEMGNRARKARMDIPQIIQRAMGTSTTIDEEWLKFIDPTIAKFFDGSNKSALPKRYRDTVFNVIKDEWDRAVSLGYNDFADFLKQEKGLSMSKWKKLKKADRNAVRKEFNLQKRAQISGREQLNMYPRKIRQLLDDYLARVGQVERFTESVDPTEYQEILKIIRNQADD